MLKRLLLLAVVLTALHIDAQNYALPNNNASCPSSCRQITWVTGSDIWNGGTLPNYTNVTCSGLTANGSTDQTSAIQACINAASSGTAVFIPANASSCYFINGTLRLKSNMVLRGAGAIGAGNGGTTLCLGAGPGWLTTQNFSFTGGGLSPAVSFATLPSTCSLSGTPQKGDTQVTLGTVSGGCVLSVGSWIKVFGNDDPSIISATGADGKCDWCGDNTGFYTQQQFEQVVSFASGTGGTGSVVNLSKALYYPLDTTSRTVPGPGGSGTATEPAGAKYNVITFGTQKAGYENFKVIGQGDIGASQIITLQGCLFCWVKGVETQNTGSSSESAHVMMIESYGNEIRDGYYHDGRSSASGANYGVYFEWANGDHKVENNIMRHNRHAIVWQGGGTGNAILYNYIDDLFTDDLTYLGSLRTSHGAQPEWGLFEGNIISHAAADDCWGSSNHFVYFRNSLWGGESGIGVPSFPPSNGYDAVDQYTAQPYYALVGNILGRTGLQATWSTGTLQAFNPFGSTSTPIVYSAGGAAGTTAGCGGPPNVGGSVAGSSVTAIYQGNYDLKSNSVAINTDGVNNSFDHSMYYATQPTAWWKIGSYTAPWPPIGLDVSSGNVTGTGGHVNMNPAYACFVNVLGSANDGTVPFSCVYTAATTTPAAITLTGTASITGKATFQ